MFYGPAAESSRPLDFVEALDFDYIDSRFDSIDAPYADTGAWLFERPEYTRWRSPEYHSSHHGFLWIKGKAGSGKSTLMKRAVENSEQHLRSDTLATFFFHVRGHALEKSVEELYRSLLLQLVRTCPDLRSRYPTHAPPNTKSQGWRIPELRNHLFKAVASLGHDRVVALYVDALDECNEDDIREAVQQFERLAERAQSADVRLYICFASRHYPSITMNRCEAINIDDLEGHQQDIARYVQATLVMPDPGFKSELASEVVSRSRAIFLWAVLVVRILNATHDRGGTQDEMRAEMAKVPRQLGGVFASMLQPVDDDLLATMQWVLFSFRPLRLQELYFAIKASLGRLDTGWEKSTEFGRYDSTKELGMTLYITNASKGLVEITKANKETVQFVHESVREYLLDGGLASLDGTASKDFVAQSHAAIALWCQLHVQLDPDIFDADVLKWHGSDEDEDEDVYRDERLPAEGTPGPFLRYAVYHVFDHVLAAYTGGAFELTSLAKFPLEAWWSADHCCFFERFKKPEPFEHRPAAMLFCLIQNNHLELAKILLTSHLNIPFQGIGRKTLLESSTGTAETFNARMDLNAPCYKGDSLFEVAIRQGEHSIEHSIVQILLDNGAHANSKALYAAAEDGNIDMIHVLLQRGADFDMKHGAWRSPLSTAANGGQQDIVQLLLDLGADPNRRCRSYGTPLIALFALPVDFRRKAPPAIVELLINRGADVNLALLVLTSDTDWHPSQCEDAAQLLIAEGADIDTVGGRFGTALIGALVTGKTDLAKLLINWGASLDHRNAEYGTALDAARAHSSVEIVEMLQTLREKHTLDGQ